MNDSNHQASSLTSRSSALGPGFPTRSSAASIGPAARRTGPRADHNGDPQRGNPGETPGKPRGNPGETHVGPQKIKGFSKTKMDRVGIESRFFRGKHWQLVS